MRTLAAVSRTVLIASLAVAALMVFGGAYFLGFVGQLERELTDPTAASQQTTAQIAGVERALGHTGFLKSYRTYLTTADAQARADLSARSNEAAKGIAALSKLIGQDATAASALREVAAIGETFSQAAATIAQLPAQGASEDQRKLIPSANQLETAYLTLHSAFERLRDAERSRQFRELGSLLDGARLLVLGALALLIVGLLTVAGYLRIAVAHPLSNLERSLNAASEGFISHHIWGTERRDEIGNLARAGEAMRRGLSEAITLKSLADKGQIHVTIEGQGSILFEKMAAEILAAADALKTATAATGKAGAEGRAELETAVARLAQSAGEVATTSTAIRSDFTQAMDTVRASSQTLLTTATEGASQMGKIAGRFSQSGEEMVSAASRVSERVSNVLGELTTSAQTMRQLASDAKETQTAFFSAYDRVTTDVAQSNEAVKNLSSRLAGLLGGTEEHLARVMGTLDRLENGLSQTLAGVQSRAVETIQMLVRAGDHFDERTASAEARFGASMSEFAKASQALGTDSEGMRQYLAQVVGDVRGARRMLEDIVGTLMAEGGVFAEVSARLKQTNDRLTNLHPDEKTKTEALVEMKSVVAAMKGAAETVRGEIAKLLERAGENQILPPPAAIVAPIFPPLSDDMITEQQRSLADVPAAEVLSRLEDLAAEMRLTGTPKSRDTAEIKSTLSGIAEQLRDIADEPEQPAKVGALGAALDRHAQAIDAHAEQAAAKSEAVSNELKAISEELREAAATAQDAKGNAAEAATTMRETSARVEERARRLFAEIEAHEIVEGAKANAGDEQVSESLDATNAEIGALAEFVAKLEARAEAISERAVAGSLEKIADTASPIELNDAAFAADLRTDGAIQSVFEAIERLNNVAAALARAGDAERRRHSAAE